MLRLTDIHSHKLKQNSHQWSELFLHSAKTQKAIYHSLFNFMYSPYVSHHLQLIELQKIPEAQNISIGIHPWVISDLPFNNAFNDDWKINLEILAANSRVKLIGECGLDLMPKLKKYHDIQLEVLKDQIELATKLQKGIVLHCVKAYQKLFELLKFFPPELPIIFHFYQGSASETLNLLQLPSCKFSFGFDLFNSKNKKKYSEIIRMIPINRILVESDDNQKNLQLIQIYEFIAKVKGIPVATTINFINNNFDEIIS